jgi:hypothetical protein
MITDRKHARADPLGQGTWSDEIPQIGKSRYIVYCILYCFLLVFEWFLLYPKEVTTPRTSSVHISERRIRTEYMQV